MIYKTLYTPTILFLVVFLLISCAPEKGEVVSAELTMRDFYSYEGAEDQLMDPLILAGAAIVPLVLNEIKSKEMPRRRYAIGALGNIQDASAIPVLKIIVGDGSEKDYFRCDALNSIGLIDFQVALGMARNNQHSRIRCLSELSEKILSADKTIWLDENYMRRTKTDAIAGRHE